jgi:hypothetical protein
MDIRCHQDSVNDLVGKMEERKLWALTSPSIREVIVDVKSSDPLKSKTFIASHRVFLFTPSARPRSFGSVKQAIKRHRSNPGIWQPNIHLGHINPISCKIHTIIIRRTFSCDIPPRRWHRTLNLPPAKMISNCASSCSSQSRAYSENYVNI